MKKILIPIILLMVQTISAQSYVGAVTSIPPYYATVQQFTLVSEISTNHILNNTNFHGLTSTNIATKVEITGKADLTGINIADTNSVFTLPDTDLFVSGYSNLLGNGIYHFTGNEYVNANGFTFGNKEQYSVDGSDWTFFKDTINYTIKTTYEEQKPWMYTWSYCTLTKLSKTNFLVSGCADGDGNGEYTDLGGFFGNTNGWIFLYGYSWELHSPFNIIDTPAYNEVVFPNPWSYTNWGFLIFDGTITGSTARIFRDNINVYSRDAVDELITNTYSQVNSNNLNNHTQNTTNFHGLVASKLPTQIVFSVVSPLGTTNSTTYLADNSSVIIVDDDSVYVRTNDTVYTATVAKANSALQSDNDTMYASQIVYRVISGNVTSDVNYFVSNNVVTVIDNDNAYLKDNASSITVTNLTVLGIASLPGPFIIGDDIIARNINATGTLTQAGIAVVLTNSPRYLNTISNNQTAVTLNGVLPPNGFANQLAQNIAYDPLTRRATVTPTGTTFKVSSGFIMRTFTGTTTSAVPTNAVSGMYYYYYDTNGVFVGTDIPWTIDGEAQAIAAYYDASVTQTVFTVDERHGIQMPDVVHHYLHDTQGSKWTGGLNLYANPIANNTTAGGLNGSNTCISISSGTTADEDIEHSTVNNGTLTYSLSTTNSGRIPIIWKDTNSFHKIAGTVVPFYSVTNSPQYITNGVWASVPEDNYFTYWLVVIGSADGTNVFMMSDTSISTSLATQQTNSTPARLLSSAGILPSSEFILAYRLIFVKNQNGGGSTASTNLSYSKLVEVADYRQFSSGLIFQQSGGGTQNYVDDDTMFPSQIVYSVVSPLGVTNSTTYPVVNSTVTLVDDDTNYQNNYGVLLVSSNTATYYSTVTGAYDNANSGDTIKLGKGVFPIGNFTLTKGNISIVGFSSKDSILTGTMIRSYTATNTTLNGFTLLNDTTNVNTFMATGWVTNYSGLRMKNIDIIASQAGSHVFEETGDNIYMENINTIATNASAGHPFVLKGVKNARVINCSSIANPASEWNNLLIKSDTTDKGGCDNVFVSGFVGSGSAVGLYIFIPTATVVSNIVVVSSRFNGNNIAMAMGSGGAVATSNAIVNSTFDISFNSTNIGVVIMDTGASETTVKASGKCIGSPLDVLYSDPVLALSLDLNIESSSLGKLQTRTLLTQDILTSSGAYDWICSPAVAVGCPSNLVRAVEVNTNGLYIVLNDSAELRSDTLVVGDPISINSGSAAGVYRLLAWGDVLTNDVPIAGAITNDQWVLVTSGTLTNGVNQKSDIQAGKVHGFFNINTGSYNDVGVEVESFGHSFGGPYFSQNIYRAAFRAGVSYDVPNGNTLSTDILINYVGISSKVFRWGKDIYIGIFGGVTVDAYLPQRLSYPRASVKIHSMNMYGNLYGRAVTLP